MSIAPTSLVVTSRSASAVGLAWVAPTGPVPASYKVYRALASTAGAWGQPAVVGTPAVATYTDSTGVAGKTYQYQVVAVTAGVDSPASNAVAAQFSVAVAHVPGPFLSSITAMLANAMGCDVTYTAFGLAPVAIRGIFNDMVKDTSGRQGADIANSKPHLLCASSDVNNASRQATVDIAGITYHLEGIDPDGAGLTTLWLSRDAQ